MYVCMYVYHSASLASLPGMVQHFNFFFRIFFLAFFLTLAVSRRAKALPRNKNTRAILFSRFFFLAFF